MPIGLHVYRYSSIGIITAKVQSSVPGTTTVGDILASPVLYVDVTLDDSTVDPEPDLSAGMADVGFILHEIDPQTGPEWAELQRFSDELSADAGAIVPADGWVDVLTITLLTNGASIFDVSAMPVLACAVGGEYQLVLNDGASDTVIVDPLVLDANPGRKAYPMVTSMEIPFTAADATYTLKLQAQAVGGGSSVTPKKNSYLRVIEHKLHDELAP